MLKRLLFILTVNIAFVAYALAIPGGTSLQSRDGLKQYPFIRIVNDTCDITIDGIDFETNQAEVIFPVNVFRLPQNSPFAKLLLTDIIPILNSDSLRLVKMFVRGAASPEGPYDNNVMLANNRAKSLFNFINERLKYKAPSSMENFNCIPEDYEYLLTLMERAKDKDYEKVKGIVRYNMEHTNIHMLKKKLRSVDRGTLWYRLLHTYYPKLRSARVIFFFEKLTKAKIEAIEGKTTNTIARAPIKPMITFGTVNVFPKDSFVYVPKLGTVPPIVAPEIPEEIHEARREYLSVKTNLLFDFAYMPGYDRFCPIPNVAIEYYPLYGHFTFGASFDCPWWQDYWSHKYFQVRNYQLETRYYFKSGDVDKDPFATHAAFTGWYLKAYAHAGLYDICFDQHRGWEGEGYGAGLGIGYSIPLSKRGHWRLECDMQAGFFTTKYDPYQWECPVDPTENDHLYYYKWKGKAEDFRKRQYRFNWLNVTRLDITLSYDLLYRRIHKRGVSFKMWENY